MRRWWRRWRRCGTWTGSCSASWRRGPRDVVEARKGGRAVDDAGVGVDGSEGADADGHHRGPVLRGGFADLVQDGGDDLIGAAGPGGGDGSAGQHLPGGVEDGGAGLGAAEIYDDVDVTSLGSGTGARLVCRHGHIVLRVGGGSSGVRFGCRRRNVRRRRLCWGRCAGWRRGSCRCGLGRSRTGGRGRRGAR